MHLVQLEEIQHLMDVITRQYGEIIPLMDYMYNLMDYFDNEYLQAFFVNIVEYWNDLKEA